MTPPLRNFECSEIKTLRVGLQRVRSKDCLPRSHHHHNRGEQVQRVHTGAELEGTREPVTWRPSA